LASGLLLEEAARQGDVTSVIELLEEELEQGGGWRGVPPGFAIRALEAMALAQPTHPGWRSVLPRWLRSWSGGVESGILAGLAGVGAPMFEAPAGYEPVAWLLHQAARALGRNDARAALACLERALLLAPDLPGVPSRDAALTAMPLIRRRAHAQTLAHTLESLTSNHSSFCNLQSAIRNPKHSPLPEILDDLAGILLKSPQGQALLRIAETGDVIALQSALADLMEESGDVARPERLTHHLALLALRLAKQHEEQEDDSALPWWRRAWVCWLRWLITCRLQSQRGSVLGHLLGLARQRITELLASSQEESVAIARRYYQLVGELPVLASGIPGEHTREVSELLGHEVKRFRDELATEYLLITREAMRFGEIPEGWRSDYERGTAMLERSLLCFESDNVRLLTTLMEICVDWFVDLYNANDGRRLFRELDRYTPHAIHLARLVSERPGELAARAVLSQFYKFRGLLSADPAQKRAFYQTALDFNPGNSNARELLAELDKDTGGDS
jgi:hypothetical protein